MNVPMFDSIYLSKIINNTSSTWLEHSKIKDYENFINSKKCYADIDYEKHGIYIINSIDDYRLWYRKYCHGTKPTEKMPWKPLHLVDNPEIENIKYLEKLENSLIPHYTSKNEIFQLIFRCFKKENILESDISEDWLSNKFGRTKIAKNDKALKTLSTKLPKKGYNEDYAKILFEIIRAINYNIHEIKNKIEIIKNSSSPCYATDTTFYNMANDGYNGIYYTAEFIHECTHSQKNIENYQYFINLGHQLATDTLIIYKWPNDFVMYEDELFPNG